MNLTLVISNPAQLLHGCQPTHRFALHGGSIGSADCDWLLNDRSHSVRPHHCQIHWLGNRACVTDHCGHTYANGHALPLGRGTTVQLNEGDFLHIGDYQIAVHLDAHELTDDRRHLSQRSLNELLTGRRDGLEDWNAHTLPFLPTADTNTHICHEFEQLSRPLDPARESDPLLALGAVTAAPPLHDVLDFAAHASADSPRVERATPHRAVHLDSTHVGGHIRFALLLLGCLALVGCTLLGKIGQVIWTPSIPVGGPDDQPSRYSLSLYASHSVNQRLIIPGAGPAETPIRSPYTVNVEAANPQALTEQLQALLDHVHETVTPQSAGLPEPDEDTQMSVVEASPFGDYDAPGVSLSTPQDAEAPRSIASPIAFKVLQLSDDSLLRNASLQTLMDDLKKTLGSTWIRADDYLLQPGQFKFIDPQSLDEDTRFIAVIAHYYDADNAQWKQTLRVDPKGHQYALLVQLDAASVELKGETR
ncbi:type VI secretion system lipoprotein TssJ [Pseudomonas helleri]|uniref:Type VI secretion system lipoprotein TssJ n=1 Tax=Pseudomonas helleri TaxID=1608996 RepID=A0A6L5HLR4_9PSED|nr:type VI secretion system lipoprotein TssJ [Pseudomonas helleri]MQU04253.1 type VI secretion system lipoprotein TssJ [Pseudomonas helleri]